MNERNSTENKEQCGDQERTRVQAEARLHQVHSMTWNRAVKQQHLKAQYLHLVEHPGIASDKITLPFLQQPALLGGCPLRPMASGKQSSEGLRSLKVRHTCECPCKLGSRGSRNENRGVRGSGTHLGSCNLSLISRKIQESLTALREWALGSLSTFSLTFSASNTATFPVCLHPATCD